MKRIIVFILAAFIITAAFTPPKTFQEDFTTFHQLNMNLLERTKGMTEQQYNIAIASPEYSALVKAIQNADKQVRSHGDVFKNLQSLNPTCLGCLGACYSSYYGCMSSCGGLSTCWVCEGSLNSCLSHCPCPVD